MKKYIKELVAKPRKTASGGKFQADLVPADVLNEAAIAERWAASAAINVTMAKTMLASLEGFVMEALGEGLQLNFNLVSFYPRLSGALSARNANPEADLSDHYYWEDVLDAESNEYLEDDTEDA